MVTGLFGTILDELSQKIGMKLEPDRIGSCLVNFANGIDMQLDLDKNNNLIIGLMVATLPIGKYRTELFKQALKANSLRDKPTGVFGFSSRKDILVLFEIVPGERLTGDQVMEILTPMMTKAQAWKAAVERGDLPPIEIDVSNKKTFAEGMFGLKS